MAPLEVLRLDPMGQVADSQGRLILELLSEPEFLRNESDEVLSAFFENADRDEEGVLFLENLLECLPVILDDCVSFALHQSHEAFEVSVFVLEIA